jgi:hypothetical protein
MGNPVAVEDRDYPGWHIQYQDEARLADIYYRGHAIDCVQVRDWDWARNPSDQTSPIPDRHALWRELVDYVLANGESATA